ncbi:hypothetical protein [Paenibacillus senegalimassiliensis]|uniref:hypothetical protein n=1 Tax=Paenibacillus senegalimassiliensis TaxID=1737426 RepID=UPI00073F0ACF|nr:hypothetical protein [Paenibacillus senegalimassiliensis]
MEMEMKSRIRINLEDNGIEISDDGSLLNVDSMSFISSVVCLEQEFSIEFPDEYLSMDYMLNMDNIYYVIDKLVNNILDCE